MSIFNEIDKKRLALETEISEAVWKYRGDNPFISFDKELKSDLSNLDETLEILRDTFEVEDFPCVEFRNSTTGNLKDIYILYINENGIHYIDVGDMSKTFVCGLNDLADIRDRLSILESIEDVLN